MLEEARLIQGTACEVFYENIQSVSEEQYAMIRRQGLGASDSSVYLGLMTKFKRDTSGLVEEKCRDYISDEEKEIGMKDTVRKGKDLEHMILEKFAKLHRCDVPLKPQHMYRITEFPYLTINFDGVIEEAPLLVPVECKFVSIYGDKYYDRSRAVATEIKDYTDKRTDFVRKSTATLIQHIEQEAARCGIPPYYYTQCQQQMMALKSPYCYLAALHDKGWELCIYRVYSDPKVQNALVIDGSRVWRQIENKKGSQ